MLLKVKEIPSVLKTRFFAVGLPVGDELSSFGIVVI
jgi:hypothetical protein